MLKYENSYRIYIGIDAKFEILEYSKFSCGPVIFPYIFIVKKCEYSKREFEVCENSKCLSGPIHDQ